MVNFENSNQCPNFIKYPNLLNRYIRQSQPTKITKLMFAFDIKFEKPFKFLQNPSFSPYKAHKLPS